MNVREKVAAEKTSLDIAFRNYRADSNGMVLSLQETMESEANCANDEAKEHKSLFVVERVEGRNCDMRKIAVKRGRLSV